MMNVLVACEESQRVCIAFRNRGHNAYSCDRVCVENPVGFMSKLYRKPNQIIQPWQFGDNYEKKTCLWLKGLPLLIPGTTEKPELKYKYYTNKATGRKRRQSLWYYEALHAKTTEERRRIRSKTFPGIAKAMAEQWG